MSDEQMAAAKLEAELNEMRKRIAKAWEDCATAVQDKAEQDRLFMRWLTSGCKREIDLIGRAGGLTSSSPTPA